MPAEAYAAHNIHIASSGESMARKPRPSVGDNLKGMWRSMRNGNSLSPIETYREIHAARDERIADEGWYERAAAEDARKAAAKRLEKQARAWVKQFGPDRSLDVKYNAKDDGSIDAFYGGIGKPDGPGHGHIRIYPDGTERIVIEPHTPETPFAKRDATILDDNTPDERL